MSASKKTNKTARKSKGHILEKMAIILIILSIAGSGLLFLMFGENAKKSCFDTFSNAYEDTKKNTYNQFKQKAYDYFEAQNHVSNQATLTIGNIKEENSLEVLSVSDSWVKISDPDTDADKTTRWVEFNATGVYTVDMSVSEFIIDDYLSPLMKSNALNYLNVLRFNEKLETDDIREKKIWLISDIVRLLNSNDCKKYITFYRKEMLNHTYSLLS